MKTRRSTAIIFIAMLLLQTVFTNVGISYQAYADDSGSSVLTDGRFVEEGTEENATRTVEFQWTLNEQVVIEEVYRANVPENSTVTEEQSGELTYDDGSIVGSYEATTDGNVFVTFAEGIEGLEKAATGTFTVEVEIEVAVDESGEQTSIDANEDSTSGEPDEAEPADGQGESSEEGTEEDPEETEEVSNDTFDAQSSGDEIVAADREPEEITENIIDRIVIVRADDSEYQEGDLLDPNEDLRFALEWSLPKDPVYIAGDTFKFKLPEQLAIYNKLEGDLDSFGTYDVDLDGNVTFTFNELIENNSNVVGTFWVETELDKQEIKRSTEELEFVYGEGEVEKVTIQIKPESGQAIQKNGQPVGGNFNTEEIEWTVDINTTRESLENAILNDPILAGQELILDSIDVKQVEVNLQGGVVEVLDNVEVSYTDESSLEELKLSFGVTDKAYRITFRTKMKEEEKDKEGSTTYHNTAYLNSDNKQQAQNGASVAVQRPKSLEKTSSAFNKGDRSVEWEVKANFTEKLLDAGTEIVDEFTFTIGNEDRSDAFEIKLEDIEILQVDSFGDNGAVGDTSNAKDLFDIDIDGNKVTYTLQDASNKAFVIKYKTKAKAGAYINDDGRISNKVTIDGKTAESGQGVYQQVGVKKNDGINYKDKTIDWTITVNADSQELKGFVLTDDFSGSGQQLVADSIKISPNAPAGATITPNTNGEGFVINFGNINEPYTIEYQTKFTYDFGGEEEKPSFRNSVDLLYTTTDEDEYTLDFGDNVNPNQQTKSNGAKNNNVNQETKEITWFIDINYNQLELDDAKLIDEIPDNQSLVGDVKVYETTINSNGTVEVGNDVTDQFGDNDIVSEENLVEVAFGNINQSYRVVFTTKDKDDIYNRGEVYKNTAQFIPRTNEVHNLTSNAQLPNQGEFLGKSGKHNRDDWTIDWEIIVNKSKSTLNGVTVFDDLGNERSQILLEDSIEVTKKGSNDPLPEEAYNVEVDGNTLTVTFPGKITDTYSITYSSYILAEETANITNEAEIQTVEETIVGNVETVETVEVKISTGGGTAEGGTGELILEKLETDTDRPLAGVEFTLTKEILGQTIVVREGTTDEEGKIHWSGLRFGEYKLTETIPQGYLGEETRTINLSADAPEGIQLETIYNERETGTAAIEKVDSVTGEKLQGAVFEITNLETGQTYSLTTGEDGTDSKEVPFGEYTVKEITAPNGYRLASNLNNTTIEIDKTTTVEIANEAITEILVSKEWDDANNQDGIRPNSVTVNLLDTNDKVVSSVELSNRNNWEYTFEGLSVYDANGDVIEYRVTENPIPDYTNSIDLVEGTDNVYVVTNTHIPEQTSAKVTKVWDDENNQDGNRPSEIQVQLLAEGDPHGDPITLNAGMDWTYTWTGLDKNANGEAITYTVQEIDAPEGYEVSINNDDANNLVITNSYEPETTEIAVSKVWDDADNQDGARTNNVTVNLLANGKYVTQTLLNEGNEWYDTFTDLPVYSAGEPITYTVTENTVSGYSTEVVETVNDEGAPEFVVTNSYTPEQTSVTVTKAWDDADNQDGTRPTSIQVQLLADGAEHGDPVTLTTGNWTYTWTGLDANAGGEAIEYTVEELDVPESYEVDIDQRDHGNIIITNSYEPETTEITVNKHWEDENNQDGVRSNNVTVNLLANGEIVRQTVLNEGNNWEHTFTSLPVNKDGIAINYTVTEDTVQHYTGSIDGFDITNSHTPEQTSVTVTKAWDDANNQDNIRPDAIEVQLTANGEDVGEPVELSATNNWTHTWTELDLNTEGEAIKYSVRELNVPEDYEVRVNDNNHGNIIVTNSYEPAVTEVSVIKHWDDDEDRDRIRPKNITVNLLADFEIVRQVVLSEANNWEHTFTNLPVNNNGEEINYSITENTVADYSTDIEGFEITNEYTPEQTTVTVSKSWDDANNQDGIRPETIEVQLYANDDPYGDSVELLAENWTYTWDDLPLNEAGEPIVYTVQEVEVPEGYEVSYNNNDHGNLIISNYHEPEVTEVAVNKIWDDAIDQDGIRPDVITINLLADDELVESKEISEEDNWQYTFTDLPKYAAGEEIVYTIEEEAVEGYETSIDEENNVTNSYTPEVLTISGEKTWNDANNQDGIRPESITVNLLADGAKIADLTVTEEDGWVYEFTNLPKYRDGGIEIIYTITEDSVNEYTTEIDGYNVTNHYTPGETSVTVTKHWDDADNQDGIRPESIEVQLTADGEPVGDLIELLAENNWTYTWDGLDEKASGETIAYSVNEVTELPEYETSMNDENHGNIIITNSYTPEEIDVTVVKHWNDSANDENTRPETITVHLYADGVLVETVEVTEETNWEHIFTELPKFANGIEIEYTVVEENVPGYISEVNGLNITNTQIGADILGTKTWKDDNATDRPESITVQVMNGDEVVQEQEVTATADWTFTFTDLAKFDAEGNEIEYTINELPVPGYATHIDGFDITNTRAETLDVAGTKTWKDDVATDRPASITVQLLANGEVVDSLDVTATTDWAYIFEGLAGYDADGVAIAYSVDEVEVDGYETSINGYDITNTLIPVEEETPVTPEDPKEDSKEDPTDKEDKGEGDTLPKTATNTFNLLMAGIILLGLGLTVLYIQRRRASQVE